MCPDVTIESVSDAAWSSFGFVYRNPLAVAIVSLAWVIASLPLLTIGPATLGVYAAVRSLREDGSVDTAAVVRTVRTHAINAFLLGGIVGLVATTGVLYLSQFVRTGWTVAGVLGFTALYVAMHLLTVLIPAFVGLVQGISLSDAVKESYRWTVTRPDAALATMTVTGGLLIASLVLTVAFVLVFPALVAWFHAELLEPLFEPDAEPVTRGETRPESAGYSRIGNE